MQKRKKESKDVQHKEQGKEKRFGSKRYSGTVYKKKKRRPAPKAKQSRPEGTIRLNKAISNSGYCSRREADNLISSGSVRVNGITAEMGTFVYDYDDIVVNGKQIRKGVKRVYIAFNKPLGIECTTDKNIKENIIDFISYHERIFPIGRLDKDSEGLILLTNDGNVVNPILRAGNAHEKEYIVSVNKPLSKSFIENMSKGVKILGTTTLPCRLYQMDKNTFSIILTQGLNRQIRRMCEAFGYRVTSLKRMRIMNISLGNLKVGTYRLLNKDEVNVLLSEIKV